MDKTCQSRGIKPQHSLHIHDVFFDKKHYHAIEEEREYFLAHAKSTGRQLVREEVFASWERSRQIGVDPNNTWLTIKLSDDEFKTAQNTYANIIETTLPLIELIDEVGLHDDYVIELIGLNGVSLFQQGNVHLHSHIAEQSIFNETTMGTNAHTLCMRYRRPFQLLGPEHYCKVLHNLTASAVPIVDSAHELTASLLFTSALSAEPWSEQSHKLLSHATGLLVGVAHAVETKLRYQTCYLQVQELSGEVNRLKKLKEPKAAGRLQVQENAKLPQQEVAAKPAGTAAANAAIASAAAANTAAASAAEAGAAGARTAGARPAATGKKASAGEQASIEFKDILGTSPAVSHALDLARRFAKTEENILLVGESGTGKEYFAQAIHNASHPAGPFMSINCAAIPPRLIESELFGYESGSFTGAERGGRPGKIELAQGGTLLLDEIGDMPLDLQATLLRVLENKRVMRLGASSYKQIEFRVIAATNRDLSEMVANHSFREDLFYRLATLSITLPPLRERPSDIEFFLCYFMEEFFQKSGGELRELSVEARQLLERYPWPGNIRQLKNAIFSSCYACAGSVITPGDLPAFLFSARPLIDTSDLSLQHLEINAVKMALQRTGYNVSHAAELLDISRATLYRKLKEYNLVNTISQSG